MISPTLTVDAEARLSGASPTLLEHLKKQLTIANPKYEDAKKYGRWIGKRLQPLLRFYEESPTGICFPRGYANQSVLLCRRLMGVSPSIIDLRHTAPPFPMTFEGELRPYQKDAVKAILEHDFGVLESGTGSGKTVIALAVIAHRNQPTLILVHTKELLYQWAERIRTFLNSEPGLLGDGHAEVRPVTVAIVNTARRMLEELPEHFGQLCVDECHRVPASLFTDVVKHFNCRFMLGLSATAFRRDGLTRVISFYLGDRSYRVDPEQLQQSGAVLRPEFIQRPTSFKYVYRGNYQALLKSLTKNHDRNLQIVNDVVHETKSADGVILVVSDRIEHCEELAAMLRNAGINAVALTGKTPADERTSVVESLQQGGVKVLVSTVQLIGEGFDCRGLETLFLTTPIKFTGRLLQVVGRILRPAAGKQPRVYDYVDPVGILKSSAQSRKMTYLL